MRYVFYINVGTLPRLRAEEYVRECAKQLMPGSKNSFFKESEEVLFLPVKEGYTRLEVVLDEKFEEVLKNASKS